MRLLSERIISFLKMSVSKRSAR